MEAKGLFFMYALGGDSRRQPTNSKKKKRYSSVELALQDSRRRKISDMYEELIASLKELS